MIDRKHILESNKKNGIDIITELKNQLTTTQMCFSSCLHDTILPIIYRTE